MMLWLFFSAGTGFAWGWRRNLSGVLWTISTGLGTAGVVFVIGAALWRRWLAAHPAWTILGAWPHPALFVWLATTPILQLLCIILGGLQRWRRIAWPSARLGGGLLGVVWSLGLGVALHHWWQSGGW